MGSQRTAEVIDKRVMLDLDLCIECRSCSAACYYAHTDLPIVQYAELPVGKLPVICRQCEEAACVAVCPAEAMYRDEQGVAKRSLAMCRGCGSCVQACPFGVLDPELTRHSPPKCDLCEERLSAGLEPRCVAACPTEALRFAVPREMEQEGLLVLGARAAGHHPLKRR